MLLRVSSEHIQLDRISEGSGTGVSNDEELIALVEATSKGNEGERRDARATVLERLGSEALVDAAGIIGTFEMQTRVADATGLPLDTPLELATRSIRRQIGADDFTAAGYVDRGGFVKHALSKVMERLVPMAMRRLSRR